MGYVALALAVVILLEVAYVRGWLRWPPSFLRQTPPAPPRAPGPVLVPDALPTAPTPNPYAGESAEGGGFGGTIQKAWERAVRNGEAAGKTKVQYALVALASLSGFPASAFGLDDATPFAEIERVYAAMGAITQGRAREYLTDGNAFVRATAERYVANASS